MRDVDYLKKFKNGDVAIRVPVNCIDEFLYKCDQLGLSLKKTSGFDYMVSTSSDICFFAEGSPSGYISYDTSHYCKSIGLNQISYEFMFPSSGKDADGYYNSTTQVTLTDYLKGRP